MYVCLIFRLDRVTIREREEIENEEERVEKEKQRQTELRKRESRRVSGYNTRSMYMCCIHIHLYVCEWVRERMVTLQYCVFVVEYF